MKKEQIIKYIRKEQEDYKFLVSSIFPLLTENARYDIADVIQDKTNSFDYKLNTETTLADLIDHSGYSISAEINSLQAQVDIINLELSNAFADGGWENSINIELADKADFIKQELYTLEWIKLKPAEKFLRTLAGWNFNKRVNE
jgi:hypothetical protein